MIVADDEWSALLDSLRPPKTARPAARPTGGGRGATPTPTSPVTAGATVSPGQPALPLAPDFAQEVVLITIPGVERVGQFVQIVDVRQEASDLFVKVRIQPRQSRSAFGEGGVDAVLLRRDSLPPVEELTIHFVDESYQLITLIGRER